MHCWNGLSPAQQQRLITVGNLPLGFEAEGTCDRPADVEILTMYDAAPGPRFYCAPCALVFLAQLIHKLPMDVDPKPL